MRLYKVDVVILIPSLFFILSGPSLPFLHESSHYCGPYNEQFWTTCLDAYRVVIYLDWHIVVVL